MSNEEFYLDGRAGWSPEDEAKYSEGAKAIAIAEKYPIVQAQGAGRRTEVSTRKGPQPLYFDLETVPDWDRADSFGLDPLPPIPQEGDIAKMPPAATIVTGTIDDAKRFLKQIDCPPAAWLDLVHEQERQRKGGERKGIVDAIDEARQIRGRVVAMHDERRKLLSTTPEFCKIAAMGWTIGGDEKIGAIVTDDGATNEVVLLELLWSLIASYSPVIAFNGIHFDLPVVLTRSAILGVAPSRMLDMKPWGKDVVDPYAIRFPKGGGNDGRPRKLKALAPLFGIEVPAGECDGSQVEALYKSDPAKLGEYVRSDVHVLRELHRKLQGYFWL